ncbi:DUF1033 family protein [Melissococcus plutonius]|uniref:DNA binding protein n=2 Tax=Melissococcus plutonius TaxID=33970 RepID=F3YA02_MELPT|nr:DUF1033 family protein [Melissococcus plutonius]BAL62294.1 DNA binding protein [Melissococcus plutonius DAT561]AIM24845.1 DNA binding protein [Melissococcus plutonius S1]KMT24974.1 DNA binding protein [Melissococcus plutonius]KMT26611.1 DNA binding protein [Melissococcus plutonius]KMT27861.1 DNA binding protein [Melissococcus plutonius]
MYQVIIMFGDNEPWWFFADWQQDIIEEKQFDCLEKAENYYRKKWQEFSLSYTYINTKPNYLAAFWRDEEKRWCEECNENLQQYRGLALLGNNYKPVTFNNKYEKLNISNHIEKVKCCKRIMV